MALGINHPARRRSREMEERRENRVKERQWDPTVTRDWWNRHDKGHAARRPSASLLVSCRAHRLLWTAVPRAALQLGGNEGHDEGAVGIRRVCVPAEDGQFRGYGHGRPRPNPQPRLTLTLTRRQSLSLALPSTGNVDSATPTERGTFAGAPVSDAVCRAPSQRATRKRSTTTARGSRSQRATRRRSPSPSPPPPAPWLPPHGTPPPHGIPHRSRLSVSKGDSRLTRRRPCRPA
jgi:hypothetical protein